jgi:hypothetical protein
MEDDEKLEQIKQVCWKSFFKLPVFTEVEGNTGEILPRNGQGSFYFKLIWITV